MTTVYEIPVEPKPEVINYSKGVQTSEPWSPQRDESSGDEAGLGRSSSRKRKRQSQRDEELRQQLRQEIEDELKALKLDEDIAKPEKERFPSRSLNPEELNVVTSSNDFLDFVERSSKVIERALDEEYDVLADYALRGALDQDEDDDYVGRKGRRIREVCQFEDERLTKRRMVSDIDFSSKVSSTFLGTTEDKRSLRFTVSRAPLHGVYQISAVTACAAGPHLRLEHPPAD